MEEYTLNALYAWNITVFTLRYTRIHEKCYNWLLFDEKIAKIDCLKLGTDKTMLR